MTNHFVGKKQEAYNGESQQLCQDSQKQCDTDTGLFMAVEEP
jgi:hypothetical protein